MEYILEIPNCELCGSDNNYTIYDKVEILSKRPLMGSFILDKNNNMIHGRNVVCVDCGLVYISPRMTRETLDKFYENEYRNIYNAHNDTKNIHSVNAINILKATNVIGTLIDIGCNDGSLLEMYNKETNVYCEGVEKGNSICDKFKIHNDIDDVTNKFDIITMLNTLEHLYSPREVLFKLRDVLTDNGHVLISVPNLYNNTLNIHIDGFFSNAHIYNFSAKTLSELMMECGYKIKNIFYINENMGNKIYLLATKNKSFNKDSIIQYFGIDNVDYLRQRIEATKLLQGIRG